MSPCPVYEVVVQIFSLQFSTLYLPVDLKWRILPFLNMVLILSEKNDAFSKFVSKVCPFDVDSFSGKNVASVDTQIFRR